MNTSAPSSVAAGRIDSIQILRAIAVFAVVISHAMHELSGLLSGKIPLFNEKIFPGDFGVDLFFVISGFIMVHVSRNAFGVSGASLDYLKRRVARIVPLYWLMTTLMVLVVILVPSVVDTATNDPRQWLYSYLFVPYARMSDGLVRPVLGLGWSLNYEMYFYLLFSIGLFFRRSVAIPLVIGLIIATWIAGQTAFATFTPARFLSQPIIFEFAAGMLLGWVYLKGFRLPALVSTMLMLAGAVLLSTAPLFDDAVERLRYLHYGIPAFLIVLGAVSFRGNEEFRASTLFLEAGENSYSTYLTHPFWLGILSVVISKAGLSAQMPVEYFVAFYLMLAVLGSFTCGFVVDRLIDKRISGAVRKLLIKRS
ncbi:MAG: acyltransferase [Nitratireductor sp.]